MLIYLIIGVSVITNMNSLNTTSSQDVFVRKTGYDVNISIPEDDIEMVARVNLTQFKDTSMILSKIWRKKTQRTSDSRNILEQYNHAMHPKPDTTLSSVVISKSSKRLPKRSEINYKEAISDEKSNKPRHVELDAPTASLGSEQWNTLSVAKLTQADRIRKITQIWLITYIVLAIPLWCSIGRCCCCLFCKRFKAQETIREAKQYSMRNPPGVLRDKSGDVIYGPSEKEREAYEELEHLIRTL